MIWLKRIATLFVPEILDWVAGKLEKRRARKRDKKEKKAAQLEEKTPTERPKAS